MKYALIERHEKSHGVRRLCTVMVVHPSGDCALQKQLISDKVRGDQQLLGFLKQAWLETGCVYGHRKPPKSEYLSPP